MITLKSITTAATAELVAAYNELTGKAIKKFSSRAAGEKQVAAALKEHEAKSKADAKAKKDDKPAKPTAKKAKKADAGDDDGLVEVAPGKFELATKPTAKRAGRRSVDPVVVTRDITSISKDEAAKNLKAYLAGDAGCALCGGSHSDVTAAGKEGTIAGDERMFCHACGNEFWSKTGKLYARRNPGAGRGVGISKSWQDKKVRAARCQRTSVIVNGETYKSVADAFRALRLPMSGHIKLRMELKANGKATFKNAKGQEFKFKVGETVTVGK